MGHKFGATSLVLLCALSACTTGTKTDPVLAFFIDGSLDRLVEDFKHKLATSDSATLTLEQWCGDHHMAKPAQIVAKRMEGRAQRASAMTRTLLQIGPDDPVRHRKVQLFCGNHMLSEADNWYVPARLTPAMNAALDGSDEPFGKVIRPLAPSRKMIGMTEAGHLSESAKFCDGAKTAFSHQVIVLDGHSLPLAFVEEHYKQELACAAR